MSTITREFTKEQLVDDIAHAEEKSMSLCGPCADDHARLAYWLRIALASLEAEKIAEPVAKIETVGVCWYADNGVPRKPAVGTDLYAAPPAPVSVPDFGALTKCIVQRLVDYGAADDDAIARAEEFVYNACRAAMLQGAEPVTTACKSPELTDAQCLEFLAVAFRHARIKGDIEFDDIRLGLKLALEAAPQQEVNP